MRIDTYKFKLVKSTNDTAISLIKKKNKKKGIIIAEKQISGRGQYGREWISYKGNLFVSIFFNLENLKLSIKQLTKINAKIIIKALSSFYKKKIFVKKPNDIIINKKKISGILQEIIHHNNVRYIIVGIGLNLFQYQL